MCSIAITNAVNEVIFDLVAAEKLFTAFTVTKEVRKKISETVLHRDVRQEVHNRDWGSRGYEGTPVTLIVAGNPVVLVYHPIGTDPLDFELALKDQDVTDTDDGDDTVNTTVVSSSNDVYFSTAARRLNIPRKVLHQVLPVGGSYDIDIGRGGVVCKVQEADGRVRIGAKALNKVSAGNRFKVTADKSTNKIQVESA